MAIPLPKGRQFQISLRHLPSDYEMPSMEVAADHYSILFLINGDRRIITPTMTFTIHPGNVSCMAPLVYHRTVPVSQREYESILIKFSPKFVEPLNEAIGSHVINSLYEYPPKSFSAKDQEYIFLRAKELLAAYEEADANFEEDAYSRFKVQNMFFNLLLAIYEKGIVDEQYSSMHNAPLTEPIMDAVYFMEKNYKENIKIEDVASVSGYSVSYFSRLFNAQLGMAFSDYLCNTRLKHVQYKLLTTDKSVTDISLECGFSYPGNMTNAFKSKFGMTPLQFRKQSTIHGPQ
jgi:AraC-like DNA-binding protein